MSVWYENCEPEVVIGKTLKEVRIENPVNLSHGDILLQLVFDDTVYSIVHYQDCCEGVGLESTDLASFIGQVVKDVEKDVNDNPCEYGSETISIYKFTFEGGGIGKASFIGSSNGYYGEGVDFREEVAMN